MSSKLIYAINGADVLEPINDEALKTIFLNISHGC